MLLSAAGMSLTGLFGKLGIANLSLFALIFWRYAAALLLLFSILLFSGNLKGMFDFKNIKIQLLRAFFVLTAQYFFFFYLEYNTLLNASVLFNTGPVFISLIEWGILRKKVGISSWISSLVAFIGMLCILQPGVKIFSFMSLAGLLSGVCQGASQVVFGYHATKEEKPHIGVLHLFIISSFFSLILYLIFHNLVPSNAFMQLDWIWIICLGAGSILNQIFRAEAYQHGTPSRSSPYLYFAVPLSAVWDWTIFGKVPNVLSFIGAMLVISGGVLKIYLRSKILKSR